MRRALALTLVAVLAAGFELVAQQVSSVPPPDADTSATSPAPAQPLFGARDLLQMRLAVPDLKKLVRDIEDENEDHPARLTYVNAMGDSVTLDIEVETRGNFRWQRRNCNFPPIRLEIPDSGVAETLFAGQGDLKLVTHCQDNKDEYEQYVLQEYLIYRVYELLTERSFQTRLARISYIDEKAERETLTKYAFIIEDHDMMAARTGCQAIELQAHPLEFSPQETTLMALFQYLMGNTDWSIAYLHNVKLMMCPDYEPVAVPYDFDWAGAISTRYARPDAKLNIRSVRERLFRGFCRPEEFFQQARQDLIEHKEEIYALYRNLEGLDPKVLEKTIEYFDDFYEIMEDDKKFKREILDECRRQ